MKIQNKLRRIKEKEKLLEIPGIYALLSDIIDEAAKKTFVSYIDSSEKINIIQEVRHRYLKYIRENTLEDLKQGKLKL